MNPSGAAPAAMVTMFVLMVLEAIVLIILLTSVVCLPVPAHSRGWRFGGAARVPWREEPGGL